MTWSDEGHYTGVVGYYPDEDSSRLRLMECPMGNIQPRQDLTWTLENFTDGPTKPTTGTFPGPIREPLLDLFSGGVVWVLKTQSRWSVSYQPELSALALCDLFIWGISFISFR